MYTVVDLFAGAGGLSLGFMQTKKYDIKVAFENNSSMQDTYKKNHPGVDVKGNVCDANYAQIVQDYGSIDVVIGGPPCQGFSNANRQKNHAISQNNMLVKQYIRAIEELQPKAFVMENVSMLRSSVHRFYLEKGDDKLIKEYGIPIKETPIFLLDEKYKFDGVVQIIQDREEIEKRLWLDSDYHELNVIYKASKNIKKMKDVLEKHKSKLIKIADNYTGDSDDFIDAESNRAFRAVKDYFEKKIKASELQHLIEPAVMLQRMLNKSLEIIDNNILVDNYNDDKDIKAIVRSFAVYDYIKCILESDKYGYKIKSDVLCAADFGAPQKRMRFIVVGVKKEIAQDFSLPAGDYDEKNYRTVRDAIEDLENVETIYDLKDDKGTDISEKNNISDLAKLLRDTRKLKNHIITKTTDTAMKRFKALEQGQNFHSLDEALKTNTYTDASRTQNTIYLRLKYSEPCGTVVNVRKSMWIHPTLDRAVSVREAARLQTFPDSFVFCGSKDKQYQQVGNAVPPIMAKAIAEKVYEIISY